MFFIEPGYKSSHHAICKNVKGVCGSLASIDRFRRLDWTRQFTSIDRCEYTVKCNSADATNQATHSRLR